MPGLPDIPQSRYQKYQADQFDRVTSGRIDAIGEPPDPEIEAVRAKVDPEYRDYVDRAVAAARANDIDPRIYVKQIYAESGFNPKAGSDEGAKGIAQFTDGTAKGWGVNPWDVDQALDGGARLMASNLKANGGDYRLALAAYNAGQGNVNRYGQRIFDASYLKGQGWSDEDATQPSAYIQRILGDTSAASASGPPGAVWPAVAVPPSGPTAGPLNASQSAQDGATGSSGGAGVSGVVASARDSLANVPFDQYADSLIGTLHLPSMSPSPSGADSSFAPTPGTGVAAPSPAPPADFGSYADSKIASLNETTGQGQWDGAPADASATGGAGPQPAAGLDPSALGSGAASPDQADSPASYLTTDTQPLTEGATQLPPDLGSGAASPDQQPTPASDLPSAPFIRPSYDDMAGANSNGQPMGLSADTGVPPGIQETDTTSPRFLAGPTPIEDAVTNVPRWVAGIPAALDHWTAQQAADQGYSPEYIASYGAHKTPQDQALEDEWTQNMAQMGALAMPNLPGVSAARGLLSKASAPVRAAIDEWIAPARNAAPEVQAALRDFANRNLQGAVDAETLGLQAKHVLGPDDSGATASLFERTGQVSPSPTADEATFAAHVRQFTNDTRDLGQQHGYLNGDVTAGPNSQVQAYFPHVYEENLNRATSAARKGGLNPNDFYSNARVYPTLDEAAANGLTPVDSFSGPLQHYAQRIASSEAKYQLVEDLKNASPAVAMDYTPGTTLPEGWVPGASIDRAFAPKPVPIPGATSVDQPGLTFTNGTAFEPNTAQAIKNILDPSWVRSTALGRGYLDTMGEGKKLLFSLSGFHNVTELRQAISANGFQGVPVIAQTLKNGFVPGAWANWRLQHADLLSDAARAGVTGLAGPGKALDTGGGLSGPAAVALRSVAGAVAGGSSGYGISKAAGADDQTALRNGLIGAGLGAIAGPAMDPIANSLWERQVPTLKALTWQIQTAAGRDPEAAAAFVNNTFGGQNLAAIARSKTVQDVARTLFLAPDWWESWTNQLGNAFKGGDQGGMARAYWARTAITSAFTLEGLNYALNHHFTNANDPDHANQLEVTGLYKLLGVDRRDPKTGAPEREYMSVLPAPVESLLNLSGGQVTKFALGRAGVLPRVFAEQAANKDYRGQPIVPPYTPTLQAARLRAANVLSQIAPIGVQQLETSSAGAEPASIAAFATATGLRTSPASKATYAGPQLSGASNEFLERNGLSWRPTPVGDAIGHVGLTRDERTYYQNLVDAARERAIASLASNPQWSRYSTAEKEAAMKTMEAHLDEEARIRVAAMIPRDEMQRRVRVKTAAGH